MTSETLAKIHPLLDGMRSTAEITLPGDVDLSKPLPRPSTHPDRREVLAIHFVAKLGEELSRLYAIDRTAKVPKLVHIRDTDKPAEGGRCANFYRYGMPEPAGEA